MQGGASADEQLGTAAEIGAVVGVAAVGSTAPSLDQTRSSQLAEVVRDQALRRADQLGELTDPAVAVGQLGRASCRERV